MGDVDVLSLVAEGVPSQPVHWKLDKTSLLSQSYPPFHTDKRRNPEGKDAIEETTHANASWHFMPEENITALLDNGKPVESLLDKTVSTPSVEQHEDGKQASEPVSESGDFIVLSPSMNRETLFARVSELRRSLQREKSRAQGLASALQADATLREDLLKQKDELYLEFREMEAENKFFREYHRQRNEDGDAGTDLNGIRGFALEEARATIMQTERRILQQTEEFANASIKHRSQLLELTTSRDSYASECSRLRQEQAQLRILLSGNSRALQEKTEHNNSSVQVHNEQQNVLMGELEEKERKLGVMVQQFEKLRVLHVKLVEKCSSQQNKLRDMDMASINLRKEQEALSLKLASKEEEIQHLTVEVDQIRGYTLGDLQQQHEDEINSLHAKYQHALADMKKGAVNGDVNASDDVHVTEGEDVPLVEDVTPAEAPLALAFKADASDLVDTEAEHQRLVELKALQDTVVEKERTILQLNESLRAVKSQVGSLEAQVKEQRTATEEAQASLQRASTDLSNALTEKEEWRVRTGELDAICSGMKGELAKQWTVQNDVRKLQRDLLEMNEQTQAEKKELEFELNQRALATDQFIKLFTSLSRRIVAMNSFVDNIASNVFGLVESIADADAPQLQVSVQFEDLPVSQDNDEPPALKPSQLGSAVLTATNTLSTIVMNLNSLLATLQQQQQAQNDFNPANDEDAVAAKAKANELLLSQLSYEKEQRRAEREENELRLSNSQAQNNKQRVLIEELETKLNEMAGNVSYAELHRVQEHWQQQVEQVRAHEKELQEKLKTFSHEVEAEMLKKEKEHAAQLNALKKSMQLKNEENQSQAMLVASLTHEKDELSASLTKARDMRKSVTQQHKSADNQLDRLLTQLNDLQKVEAPTVSGVSAFDDAEDDIPTHLGGKEASVWLSYDEQSLPASLTNSVRLSTGRVTPILTKDDAATDDDMLRSRERQEFDTLFAALSESLGLPPQKGETPARVVAQSLPLTDSTANNKSTTQSIGRPNKPLKQPPRPIKGIHLTQTKTKSKGKKKTQPSAASVGTSATRRRRNSLASSTDRRKRIAMRSSMDRKKKVQSGKNN